MLNRLRAMSAAETTHRVRQLARARLEARGLLLAGQGRRLEAQPGKPWLSPLPRGFEVAPHTAAADRILAGTFRVFAMHEAGIGFPPRWNRDPASGIEVGLAFGKSIDYRDERRVGNIKYLWEPNRHLELVTLAQAWHLTGETRYAQGCRALLDSWLEQCPYPRGVNWISSLELAIRLVNWAFAWQLLGGQGSPLFAGSEGAAFERRWMESVYRHCHFVSGHPSLHSSANNHLLGELFGLQVAALTWPFWRESASWADTARREFEREALKQNAADGVNHEQAIWYHHEVADMMLIAGLVGRANGREFSDEYWQRWEAMLEFIASLMDVAGKVPQIGDADDAVMVRFSPDRALNVYRSLLATGAVLRGRCDFKAKAGVFDAKSRWLLGDDAAARFDALRATGEIAAASPRRAFPEGGYYILGSDFDTSREVRIVADAAPLGFLSIAAHGHADALSFTLSAAGREILIDPGTYAYHTDEEWRNYFKGTSAHNTLRVDGMDQSVSGGKFLWIRHANATCERFETTDEADVFVGSHDGYRRLRDPVTHRRELIYRARERALVVVDSLSAQLPHRIELFWHFGEECEVALEQGGITIRNHDVKALLRGPGGLRPRVARGQEGPPLGWISREFDAKEPCITLVLEGEITGDWRGETRIELA